MKKMKVLFSLLVCIVLVAGCGSGSSSNNGGSSASGNTGTSTSTPANTSANSSGTANTTVEEPAGLPRPTDADFADGPIEVRYWAVFSGSLAEAVDAVINKFNESQDRYVVVREFQGGAGDIIAKLQSSVKEDLPAMFTGAVENVGYFRYSDYTLPLQSFIESDPEDFDLSKTYPHLVSSYSDGDANLIGYPMGNSFAGVFYNAEIFEAAGIDPATIKSYPDIYDAAKKIIDGGHAKHGVAFHKNGYYLNAALAVEGVLSFDNNNGYDGIPTKVMYNESPTKEALQTMLGFYQDLYKTENLAMPYGTNPNDEIVPAFANGELAMFHGVISYYDRILSAGGDQLDIGLIPMPAASENGRSTGVPPGGTGNFIADNGDILSQWGAYEFIKFAASAENQALFATMTGYLPVGSDGADTDMYKQFVEEKFPRVQVALDAQKNGDRETKTPFVPIANELLRANLFAIESVANDPSYDIDQAIEEAQRTITEAIELWTLSNVN